MLPLKCAGTKPYFVKAVISSNKPFCKTNAMFMYVLACSTIQYCDESFNGAEVICRWLFRERVHFLQNTQLQLESLPTVFHDQGERMFYCTL